MAIAYPDDGYHGRDMCTHWFIGGNLVRAAGFLAHPWFKHNCTDSVWYDVGEEFDLLHYVPETRFRHEHPGLSDKYPTDETYQRAVVFNLEAGYLFDNVYLGSDNRQKLFNRVGEALSEQSDGR